MTMKTELRSIALAERSALSQTQRQQAAQDIAKRPLPFALTPGAILAGYWPIKNEIDPFPLMTRLAEAGARLTLPVVAATNHPLQFRAWSPDIDMEKGAFGILQPPSDAQQLVPDIVITPLAAFDRSGHRIGYGAGYYDRSLVLLRLEKPVIAVGMAFSVQEVPHVPFEAHDVPLDFVLTEIETLDCRSR